MYGYHMIPPIIFDDATLGPAVRDAQGNSIAPTQPAGRRPGVMLADDAEAIAHRMRELGLDK